MPNSGFGVAGGMLPPILFGGVLGAGCGTVILYAGALEADPTIEDIFAEKAAAKADAHSAAEAKRIISDVRAASVMEARRGLRGFAAMFM